MEQGRRFVGIELKESYFQIQAERTSAPPPSSKNHRLYRWIGSTQNTGEISSSLRRRHGYRLTRRNVAFNALRRLEEVTQRPNTKSLHHPPPSRCDGPNAKRCPQQLKKAETNAARMTIGAVLRKRSGRPALATGRRFTGSWTAKRTTNEECRTLLAQLQAAANKRDGKWVRVWVKYGAANPLTKPYPRGSSRRRSLQLGALSL